MDTDNITKENAIRQIRDLMYLHKLEVVTPSYAYTESELLCDPLFWVEGDLGDQCTLEQWSNSRAAMVLHERLIDEGINIISDLALECSEEEEEEEE
jgi:hypothetical protein